MSLRLDQGTDPEVQIKTYGSYMPGMSLSIGNTYTQITPKDMRAMMEYYLTNADLDESDERVKFVNWVRHLKTITGYNSDRLRLSFT